MGIVLGCKTGNFLFPVGGVGDRPVVFDDDSVDVCVPMLATVVAKSLEGEEGKVWWTMHISVDDESLIFHLCCCIEGHILARFVMEGQVSKGGGKITDDVWTDPRFLLEDLDEVHWAVVVVVDFNLNLVC